MVGVLMTTTLQLQIKCLNWYAQLVSAKPAAAHAKLIVPTCFNSCKNNEQQQHRFQIKAHGDNLY